MLRLLAVLSVKHQHLSNKQKKQGRNETNTHMCAIEFRFTIKKFKNAGMTSNWTTHALALNVFKSDSLFYFIRQHHGHFMHSLSNSLNLDESNTIAKSKRHSTAKEKKGFQARQGVVQRRLFGAETQHR